MIVIFSKHKKSHANAWDRNSIYFMSLVFLKTQPLFADIEACYRVQFHNTIGNRVWDLNSIIVAWIGAENISFFHRIGALLRFRRGAIDRGSH